MLTALINGLVGLGLCIGISLHILDWSLFDVMRCIIASNLAAFVGMLVTLHIGKVFPFLSAWLKGSFRVWIFLSIVFLFVLFGAAPQLMELRPLLYLLLPLVLSTGFSIILFGPVQDTLVRREQRKTQR